MTDIVPTGVNYESLFSGYMTKDIFQAFLDGELPGRFQPKNRYDELLLDEVLGFLFHHPLFQEWRDTLKYEEGRSSSRIAPETPVIATGYNLSIQEVRSLRNDSRVILRFMKSMASSLEKQALPYEEIFAVLMDGIFTTHYVIGTNLENVH